MKFGRFQIISLLLALILLAGAGPAVLAEEADDTCTVTYYYDMYEGDEDIYLIQTVKRGERAAEPEPPDIPDFAGWFRLEPDIAEYDFDEPVTGDIELYADRYFYIEYFEDHYAYMTGYPDGTIRPEQTVSRAEAATMFFRVLDNWERGANWTRENEFSDVSATAWYNNAVSTISRMGLITGYSDGTFRPDETITRAELAAIVSRLDGGGEGEPQDIAFTDISGCWAEDIIRQAAESGLVTGYSDGTFRPDREVTRAELAAVINRLREIPEDEGELPAGMITWTDNMDTSQWYYIDIQEATNSHVAVYSGRWQGEFWHELLETPDWSQIESPEATSGYLY